MKDLDFDEIDRAVNSVITNMPSDDSSQIVAKVNVSNPAPVISQIDTPSTPPVLPPKPLAGRRTGGQFMDVVHPSSDMRKTTIVRPERAPIPSMASFNKPPASASTPVIDKPALTSFDNAPEPVEINKPTETTTDTNQFEDADIEKLNSEINQELGQVGNDVPDSPFLSGAKVEKRPLGAFSDDQATTTGGEPEKKPTEGQEILHHDMTKPNLKTPLPAELQDDLLKVESDSVSLSDTPVVVPEEVTETTDYSVEVKPEVEASATVQSQPAAIDEHPTGPTSIVQQYKEQPSSGDQSSGAIYDTDSYHKTLVKPHNKKSGWMWVLWTAVIIVIGAAAGAAIFIWVIPNL